MLKASFRKLLLHFHRPSGTSRGIMHFRETWLLFLSDPDKPDKTGIGECGMLQGLSIDDQPDFEKELARVVDQINSGTNVSDILLMHLPSVRFGVEMALLDLAGEKDRVLFPSGFTRGEGSIPINGLVWMGDYDFMQRQVRDKINEGYSCIKLKIGSIDFEQELKLIRGIRQEFSVSEIQIRVDANGAFSVDEAPEKIKRLSDFDIHSIEQPIQPGQWENMARLCEKPDIPIALDEELIGIQEASEKYRLLEWIKPQYIILKPTLTGGFAASEEWIEMARRQRIGWWVTSALESNIGLNALAQWVFTLGNPLPQGLGTGLIYRNNPDSPLTAGQGFLSYLPDKPWRLNDLIPV